MRFDRKSELLKIASLRLDPDALGNYLKNLAETDPDSIELIDVFESFLFEQDWYLKQVGLYILLFLFKIKNNLYKELALRFLTNPNDDFEVRMWSVVGLGECYQDTKDIDIMKTMIKAIRSEEMGVVLRNSCLKSVIRIWRLTQLEVFQRANENNDENDISIFTHNIAEFKNELNDIENYIAAY